MTVPKLRFPEFRDAGEWEKLRLSDVSDRITEKVGNRKLMTVSITAGTGFVSQAQKFSRDISGSQYKNYIRLKKGEFSYNKGNSKKFPQGCVYKLKEFDEVATPNSFISFRIKEKYVADFYTGYFENNAHGSQLTKYITSGARSDGLLNISSDDFFSIIVPTPLSQQEQQTIADCLASLDDRLAAETQTIDTLKAHKKGLMQQLFPAEGETLPKLRFPEFHDAGEWEYKEIKDLDIYISDGNYGEMYPKSEEMKRAGIPFIRANNIKDSQLVWTDMKYIDADLHTLLTSGHLEENDILVTTRGDIGMVAYVTKEFHGANINAQICLLRCAKNLNSYYLMQYLGSNKGFKQFKELQTGSALKQLPKKNLGKVKIYLPTLPEQQTIADCLGSLDETIAAQAETIALLKVHKKGLMQQLFPAVEEAKR